MPLFHTCNRITAGLAMVAGVFLRSTQFRRAAFALETAGSLSEVRPNAVREMRD